MKGRAENGRLEQKDLFFLHREKEKKKSLTERKVHRNVPVNRKVSRNGEGGGFKEIGKEKILRERKRKEEIYNRKRSRKKTALKKEGFLA